MKIPIPGTGEAVYMQSADERASCAIHDWPTDGLARRLIEAMRAAHGKGGVNACKPCISRAKEDADRERGKAPR